MNRFRIGALVLAAIFASAIHARACSCSGPLPPNMEMAETCAVFTGKVIKQTETTRPLDASHSIHVKDVTIEVATVIKGKALKKRVGKNVVVETGMGDGDCGYSFEEGKQYLVYACSRGPKLETSGCSRTKPMEEVEDEILELQDRLPKIPVPPRPPELVLKGTTDENGDQSFVFELRNYLHERIFYGPMKAQVLRNGHWEDYPVNDTGGPREEPKAEEIPKMLAQERTRYAGWEFPSANKLRDIEYLGRMRATTEFAAVPSRSSPWRVGFAYEVERLTKDRKTLLKSRHLVWGPPIDDSVVTKKLTFNEAFKGNGMIPFSTGTKPPAAGEEGK